MAKASKEQVEQLLKSDQMNYVLLAQAYEILVNLSRQYNSFPVEQKNFFNTYRNKVGAIYKSWQNRQGRLKSAGADTFALDAISGNQSWKDRLTSWFNSALKGFGLGVLPVIAIAIIAAAIVATTITAAVIVDMLTTSASERTNLLSAVGDLKTKFGFSDSQINDLMKNTKPSGGLFAGIFAGAGAIIIGALLVFNWDKIKKIFK